jgi:hypothetical protein
MNERDIKKGDRVTWVDYKSDRVVKGEVLKVETRNYPTGTLSGNASLQSNGRAQVLSGQDFQKYSIELSRLQVRLPRQGTLIEVPQVEEQSSLGDRRGWTR